MPQKPTIDEIRSCMRAAFPVEAIRSVDEESRKVEVAFSSDAELEQWWRTILVLEHSRDAVRLDRLNNGGPALFNHDRSAHIGVVEEARIDADGKGRAVIRFSESPLGEEKFRDVQSGVLRHVSVGFSVHSTKLVEEREDGFDVYRATDWEPYEISFVTIPLDDKVGVGRTFDAPEEKKTKMEERHMPAPAPEVTHGTTPVDVGAERDAAVKAERERSNVLLELGREYNAPEDAARFVSEGKSADEFRQYLLKTLDSRGSKPTPDEMSEPVGLSDKDIARYSFVKVLRALDPNNAKARREAAFELEASEAAAARLGRDAEGIVVPPEVLTAPVSRAYDTGTGSAPHGGSLVGTDLLAGSFIEMLRRRTLLLQNGTKLAGLVGNVAIPKQNAGATAYVVGEDTDITESDGDFGQVGMTPHTIGALSEISRRLLMQGTPDVEMLVRSDLAQALGLKMDHLGFYGTGTNEPTGIKNTDGVNAVTFATAGKPTFAEILKMETEVAADDADVESMLYLLNARMRGHCKGTPKFTNTEATIWEPGNTVNGYKVGVTNQIAANDAFFGNFADLIVGLWGGLELTLDPYTHSSKGRLRIVAMQDFDVALRHGESFCVGTSA